MTISSSSAWSLIYLRARPTELARTHTNTKDNGQCFNPLRGLTRWTVIRCPSLVDAASDRVTATRTWLTSTPVDPQILGILACGTVGIDEVAQAGSVVLERVVQHFA